MIKLFFVLWFVLYIFHLFVYDMTMSSLSETPKKVIECQIQLRDILIHEKEPTQFINDCSSIYWEGMITEPSKSVKVLQLKWELQTNLLSVSNLEELEIVFPNLDKESFKLTYDLIKDKRFNILDTSNHKFLVSEKYPMTYVSLYYNLWGLFLLFVIIYLLRIITSYKEIIQNQKKKKEKNRLDRSFQ